MLCVHTTLIRIQHIRKGVFGEFHTTDMSEVEEALKRIKAHGGVIGILIVNNEGIPIKTTLDNTTTVLYAGILQALTLKAKHAIREIDPQNELTFLRIRSKKHEIMVAPDKEYTLVCIQNINDHSDHIGTPSMF